MKSERLAVLSVLLAIFSLQIGASLAKSVFPVFGPEGTTLLRILFAAMVLMIIFRPWREKLDYA